VNLFCPDDSVTRAQMAIFIIRARYGAAFAFDYTPAPYFADVPTGAFGFDYIQRMRADSITSGCTATTYCPNEYVTRGDMAIFIMRGGFNQLLPSTEPVIVSVSPATLTPGGAASFTITGLNTTFEQGITGIAPVDGVTFGPVTVSSPTSLTVQATAASTAQLQPVSLLAITASQEAVLPNGLTIQ
jgi:hypothetical protein